MAPVKLWETPPQGSCDLDSVITTEELDRRPTRPPDIEKETRVLLSLTRELATVPKDFFGRLVAAALKLSIADSAGVSLLNKEQKRFVWPAVSGGLSSYVGAGTPSDFGPCGTVLDRQRPMLFSHPERHFTYLAPITPALEEVLLTPFFVDGKAVGTVWAVIHEAGREFDAEDRRLLENLSLFAASAYRELRRNGTLGPMLGSKPDPK
jgi:GAF domain-containing protein